MKTSFVSTLSLSSTLRSSLLKAQESLIGAQKEVTTGRFADIGLAIGARTGQTVSVRTQYDRIDGIIDTNGLVASRLDASQKALDGMLETAQKFLGTLIGVRSGEKSADVLVTEAKNNLQAVIATGNSSMAGQYIFAGIDTQQKPMTDYFATPAAANKTAIDAAFAAAPPAGFGMVQDAAGVSGITATEMTAFLQGAFAAEFQDPAWTTNWSNASSANVNARISPNEVIEVSTNANEQFMRNLAKVYTMAADLGTRNLNTNAYQALVDEAIDVVNNAVRDLTAAQAQLGSAEARVTTASDRLSIQRDILAKQVSRFEAVDPFEAQTRVSQLTTQIETSYALTARIQNLSILNYMR